MIPLPMVFPYLEATTTEECALNGIKLASIFFVLVVQHAPHNFVVIRDLLAQIPITRATDVCFLLVTCSGC